MNANERKFKKITDDFYLRFLRSFADKINDIFIDSYLCCSIKGVSHEI